METVTMLFYNNRTARLIAGLLVTLHVDFTYKAEGGELTLTFAKEKFEQHRNVFISREQIASGLPTDSQNRLIMENDPMAACSA